MNIQSPHLLRAFYVLRINLEIIGIQTWGYHVDI